MATSNATKHNTSYAFIPPPMSLYRPSIPAQTLLGNQSPPYSIDKYTWTVHMSASKILGVHTLCFTPSLRSNYYCFWLFLDQSRWQGHLHLMDCHIGLFDDMTPNKWRKRRSQGHGDDPRSTQLPMLTTLHWEPMTLHLITTHGRFRCYILSMKLYPWPYALRATESSCWKADVVDMVSIPVTLPLRLALASSRVVLNFTL
jgi:hypothetical protein